MKQDTPIPLKAAEQNTAVLIDVKEGNSEEVKRSSTYEDSDSTNSHLRGFLLFLFSSVVITSLLLTPAIYFCSNDRKNIPDLVAATYAELSTSGQLDFIPQVVRWYYTLMQVLMDWFVMVCYHSCVEIRVDFTMAPCYGHHWSFWYV
jgi:hypothetical protein